MQQRRRGIKRNIWRQLIRRKWEKFEDWLVKVGQKKMIKKIIETAYNKEQTIRETITEVAQNELR